MDAGFVQEGGEPVHEPVPIYSPSFRQHRYGAKGDDDEILTKPKLLQIHMQTPQEPRYILAFLHRRTTRTSVAVAVAFIEILPIRLVTVYLEPIELVATEYPVSFGRGEEDGEEVDVRRERGCAGGFGGGGGAG